MFVGSYDKSIKDALLSIQKFDNEKNNRNNKEDVNIPTKGIHTNNTEQPKNQENNTNRNEHKRNVINANKLRPTSIVYSF